MSWFYRIADQEWGPIAPEQLLELIQSGAIPPEAWVKKGEQGEWLPASQVRSLVMSVGSLVARPTVPDEKQVDITHPRQRARRLRRLPAVPQTATVHPMLVALGTALVVLVAVLVIQGRNSPLGQQNEQRTADPEQRPAGQSKASEAERAAVADNKLNQNLSAISPRVPSQGYADGGNYNLVQRTDQSVVLIEAVNRSGSGFLIDRSGTLVTNLHVVQNAGSAQVRFVDGSIYEIAGFLAIAPEKDLVLLQIRSNREDFESLPITEQLPQKGEKVYALGAPRGYLGSITDGIVSAIRSGDEIRKIAMGQANGADRLDAALEFSEAITWIQTSSPISPGNSGGPLVNSHGEVVGVNTWMQTDAQNVNFAVSSESLLELMEERGEVQPLAMLPTRNEPLFVTHQRRQDEEVRQMRADREQLRTRQQKLAASSRGKRNARIAQELVHLEDLIKECRIEIRNFESERAKIVADRERIRRSAKAVYLESENSADRLRRGRAELNRVNKILGGPNAKTHYSDTQWGELLKRRDALKGLINHIREHGKILDKRHSRLSAEDKKLEDEIKFNFVNWQTKKKEVSIYEIRYAELQVQFPK